MGAGCRCSDVGYRRVSRHLDRRAIGQPWLRDLPGVAVIGGGDFQPLDASLPAVVQGRPTDRDPDRRRLRLPMVEEYIRFYIFIEDGKAQTALRIEHLNQ